MPLATLRILIAIFTLEVVLLTALPMVFRVGHAQRARPERPEGARMTDAMPIVIGHRGASGYRPEHTLASYQLAIDQGADYIEPDLVITKDGVLIARHENEIGGTTNVAEKFSARRTTKRIDDEEVSGWFSEDFTLAELKTVTARERLEFRSHAFDGQFQVPTLEDVLTLARDNSRRLGRAIGVYPETKHPSYFRAIGLPLEERLLETLGRFGHTQADAPILIQSFEIGNLQSLRKATALRLVQLIDESGSPFDSTSTGRGPAYSDMVRPAGLREIAAYANGIGVNKSLLVSAGPDGQIATAPSIVSDAHAAGLFVHAWTVRPEDRFLPAPLRGRVDEEFRLLRSLGVDGVFTDVPDIGVRVLRSPSAARP